MAKKLLSVCASCRHAEWKRTANGRRHPDGTGQCGYQVPDSPLPKALSVRAYSRDRMVATVREMVQQYGGSRYVSWQEYHRIEAEPCATWEAQPK